VDEALDAGLELDEGAVVGERHDLAGDLHLHRVALRGGVPRIVDRLLEAERDALRLRVVLEDLDGDLVADVEDLGRVVDPAPAHVGDVEEAIDAAEVHERAVLGDVLDDARDDHALFEVLERPCLELVALLLEEHAAREHDVAALLVELDDLEVEGLAEELVEVADGAEVHLAARQERLHAAADADREAALHARGDRSLDELVALARGADLVPHLELVGLLLREEHEAVVGLLGLDEHVDLSPTLTASPPAGSANSSTRMTPSDLYPMSTTTWSLPTAMTVPETMSPSLRVSAFATDCSKRSAKPPGFLGVEVWNWTVVIEWCGLSDSLGLGWESDRSRVLVGIVRRGASVRDWSRTRAAGARRHEGRHG
jgi:hypothetical protein